jgi:hypothetical protein
VAKRFAEGPLVPDALVSYRTQLAERRTGAQCLRR